MAVVERVTSPDEVSLADVNTLILQIRRRPEESLGTEEELAAVTRNPDTVFVAAKDGQKVVGMGLVFLAQKFGGRVGFVESIVVLDSYRGRGLGRKIMELLISESKKASAKGLDLTSHPERVAANALYEKLGFEKRETNVYRLRF